MENWAKASIGLILRSSTCLPSHAYTSPDRSYQSGMRALWSLAMYVHTRNIASVGMLRVSAVNNKMPDPGLDDISRDRAERNLRIDPTVHCRHCWNTVNRQFRRAERSDLPG